MSGPHYISASNREVTGRSVAVYLSPGDVAAYRAAMLGAGDVLGGLLSCEFPNADLVSDALYAVTKVVGVYGLEGKWVTSRASGDRSEFLSTSEVREVRAIVIFVCCGQHVFRVSHSRCSF